MKKLFTLAAASAMAATSFGAQAQVAVDGVLNANEITAGNYVLIGKYTNPRGFGDNGLLSLYAASTANKVYFFVGGTLENNGNGFQLFLDLPTAGGVPAGTALPAGAAGTYNAKVTPKLELATDLSLTLRSTTNGANAAAATDFRIEAANYANATTVVAKEVTTTISASGTAMTIANDADFPMLAGAKVSYKQSIDGRLKTNPGANTTSGTTTTPIPTTDAAYGGVGSYGWEIELDRAAIGGTAANSIIKMFVIQNGGDGGYFSSDFIPQTSAPLTTNGGNLANGTFDFSTLPGTQAAGINLTATGVTLDAKSRATAASLQFGLYPNPGSAVAVKYTVPQGKQAVELNVFDATGKQVRSLRQAQSGAQSYSLSNLRAGIYVVKLSVGGQQTSGKVVVE